MRSKYNLEAALLRSGRLVIVANLVPLPGWFNAGLRVEYFVKVGIVLLGATFPLTLIATAGPVALGQATFISVLTCLTIFFIGRAFGLDKRLCAVIGVGGAVCGVSASIAIAASVGAKKEDLYTSVTLVVVWALIMILVLPFVSQALGLSAGVAGAWIGTSEFADAAGFAAASAYRQDGRQRGRRDQGLHADESHRPRPLDRHMVARLCLHCHHVLGARRSWAPGPVRAKSGAASLNS